MKAVVADALERYGRLDVFFANAGVAGPVAAFTDFSDDDFMSMLRTNTLRYMILRLLPRLSLTRLNKQRLPRHQARCPGNEEDISGKAPTRRQHHRHCLRRRNTVQCRIYTILRIQGRRRLASPDDSLPARRDWRARQRYLPRCNRDGNDGTHVRDGSCARHGEEDWPAQSFETRSPRGRGCPGGAVPRQ